MRASFLHFLRLRLTVSVIGIAVLAVLCGLMAYFTPCNHDDLGYNTLYGLDALASSDLSVKEFLSRLLAIFTDHYETHNGRMADKVLLPFLMMPKWVISLMTALSVAVILNAGKFVSDSLRGEWVTLAIGSVLILSLPWYEPMFTGAFSVNYLWGAAVALICFGYLTGLRRPGGIAGTIFCALLMFVGGAWHEGFGLCVSAAVATYFIVKRSRLSWQQILFVVMWLSGVSFTLLSPASWNRLDETGGGLNLQNLLQPELLICFNITLLYIPLFLFSLLRAKFRACAGRNNIASLSSVAIMIIANLLLVVRIYIEARIAMFSGIFAIPGLVMILIVWHRAGRLNLLFRMRKFAAIVITLVAIAHLAVSLCWQVRLDKEFSEIVGLYEKTKPGGIIYYPLTAHTPWYTLGKPSVYQLRNGWGLETFTNYYGNSDKPLKILPVVLQGTDPIKDGRRIGGKFDIYIVRGCLFARLLGNYRSYMLKYTFADGRTERIKTLATVVYSSDGQRFAYLQPMPGILRPFGTIKKIE